ncbi:hypothetical protein C8F04DRAFT_1261099 [Mycena alexandri]|uniref:F-box domain-containing protein n=1 Tax=Mycena alexandri TaxID=1745969 RepID=A0AAD6STS5_9AGAR|nr:hypothetical protein C8F04DRAFT_1261099 [Mycena alexandri]
MFWLDAVSLFLSESVDISGAGLSCTTLRVHGRGSDMPKILHILSDSDITINKQTLTWAASMGRHQPMYELRFTTLRLLEAFLFALSFVRYLNAKTIPSGGLAAARRVVMTAADHRYLQDLSDIFLDLRTTHAEVKCPIHRLPVELVSEIFLFCPPPNGRPARLELPLLLLHVCAKWRAVAANTSGLWRTASFTLGCSFIDHQGNHHAQMASWLARAKAPTASLSITVDESHNVAHKAFRIARYNPSLFALVRNLSISSPRSQLPNLLGGDAPALESLSLAIQDDPRWLRGLRPTQLAPRFYHLPILAEGIGNRRPPRFLAAFPWLQLNTLTLKINMRFSVWMTVFSQCTSLRAARFIVWNDSRRYPMVPVTFPHLQSLHVTFRGICETSFFDHLAFPVIRELLIVGLPPLHPRTPFIPRFATLRALFLDIPDSLSTPLVEAVVRVHPKLEQLSFIVDQDPDNYTALFQLLLRQYWLQTLTISTPMGDDPADLRRLTRQLTRWAVGQTALGCEFRLFGKMVALEAFRNALTPLDTVEGELKLYPAADDFDDPFIIFPYSRLIFFSVCNRLAIAPSAI